MTVCSTPSMPPLSTAVLCAKYAIKNKNNKDSYCKVSHNFEKIKELCKLASNFPPTWETERSYVSCPSMVKNFPRNARKGLDVSCEMSTMTVVRGSHVTITSSVGLLADRAFCLHHTVFLKHLHFLHHKACVTKIN